MSPCINTNDILDQLGLYGGEPAMDAIERLAMVGPQVWPDWATRKWIGARVVADAEVRNRLRPVSAREVVAATVQG